jgi:hypothetical protein
VQLTGCSERRRRWPVHSAEDAPPVVNRVILDLELLQRPAVVNRPLANLPASRLAATILERDGPDVR